MYEDASINNFKVRSIAYKQKYYNKKFKVTIRYHTYRQLFKKMGLTSRKILVKQTSA